MARISCPECGGRGRESSPCYTCKGTGRFSSYRKLCPECYGKGFANCAECAGSGYIDSDRVRCIVCRAAHLMGKIACTVCNGEGVNHLGATCATCKGQKFYDCACGGSGYMA